MLIPRSQITWISSRQPMVFEGTGLVSRHEIGY